jgi:receptor expression-enhancing protein 1/2/3/4
VYESFFKPYIAKHETEIDQNLLELRTRAGDMALVYFQRISSYAQTRSYEILQYIASQSQYQSPRSQVLYCFLTISFCYYIS